MMPEKPKIGGTIQYEVAITPLAGKFLYGEICNQIMMNEMIFL